jgi:outer membrane protein TolC
MRQQLEIEKLNYASAKTRLLPKLSAVLGISQDEQSYTVNIAQKYKVNSYFGGLSVNWNIFDGLAAGAAQRNTLARRRQVENDYRSLTETLAQQAQIQVKQLNFSARSMAIADRSLVASESTLKARQDEFARGVIAESDVSVTRLMLYDSMINAFNYRIDYMTRIGDFLGTIVEDPVVANIAQAK